MICAEQILFAISGNEWRYGIGHLFIKPAV